MSESELIKNYEKYITEINNKVDILMKEMSSLHEKIDKLSKDKSPEKDEEHYITETEEELLLNIYKGIFNRELKGKKVILKEGEYDTHIWIIVRVNSDSYDLWYNGSIGKAAWKGYDTDRYWINNSATDTTYVRGLCNSYKSKLSSNIQARLKPGLNRNCGDDLVVILSVNQLGYTYNDVLNDSNTHIPYFNSDSRRNIEGTYYWTTSAYSSDTDILWEVMKNGDFGYGYGRNIDDVVPAIRLG